MLINTILHPVSKFVQNKRNWHHHGTNAIFVAHSHYERAETLIMGTHIKIVGIGNIVFGIFGLLLAILTVVGFGTFGALTADLVAAFVIGGIALFAGMILAVFSICHILGGYGLLKNQNWGRYILIAISIVNLFSFPIGTIICIYVLWVLFHRETQILFTSSSSI